MTIPTPSSLDLREAADQLEKVRNIYVPEAEQAVANVAAWLRALASQQDEDWVQTILANLRGRAA